MAKLRWFLLLCLTALPLLGRADVYVIANKALPHNDLSKDEIAAIYLLKKKHWDDGDPILPINLPAQSQSRNVFTEQVFNSTPEKLGGYWDQMLFKGITPPLTQNSEQAVMLFVERMKGAIGYVEQKPDNPNLKVIYKIAAH